MASPATRNILRVPGKIVKDPTDLSAADPYGGTVLGDVHQITVRLKSQSYVLTAEEWGGAPWEVIHAGYPLFLAATLRGIDNDAMAAIFPDTVTGDPSGETNVRFRVDNGRAGTLLSTKSMKLLFVPNASLRHRAIILRDAVPVAAEDASWGLNASEEQVTNVVWYAIPDKTNRVAEMAFIKDLAL
ncbi:MAG: hypothetical protein DRQ55_17525 [Planctomycetota bacterium]|nr:MAG: hypothetical protein DRQ55_17525 [Planctomycetota bacterium]